uniref:Uncharacterized protein n=2 Tax=Caenorhabditis japonica TaxID=281687 RepID=A0A8R1IH11_CAEJA
MRQPRNFTMVLPATETDPEMYLSFPSFTFSLVPPAEQPIDSFAELKTSIRRAAHNLRDETVRFIEQNLEVAQRQVTESPRDPEYRLPCFYTKGYIVLRRLCRVISPEYKCPILEFVPNAVQMAVLSEHGVGVIQMPRVIVESGMLVEGDTEDKESLQNLVDAFFKDMEEYFYNYMSVCGTCPPIPQSFNLMKIYLKKRATNERRCDTTKRFFKELDVHMNIYLTGVFGEEHVPVDYFKTHAID